MKLQILAFVVLVAFSAQAARHHTPDPCREPGAENDSRCQGDVVIGDGSITTGNSIPGPQGHGSLHVGNGGGGGGGDGRGWLVAAVIALAALPVILYLSD